MKIKDLFHFEKGILQSTKCTPGEFDFITASSDWKTHNEYTHECEALIFAAAASGSLGRTHYVNGKFISSDLCFILTPKDQKKYPIDLKFYHLIFQAFKDEIVRNTKAGTSKEAIGLTAFGKYELPYFDVGKQIETKEKFVNAQESTVGLSSELTHQLDLVKQLRQAFLREAMEGKLTKAWRSSHPELVSGPNSASQLLAKNKAEKETLVKAGKLKSQKPPSPIKEDEIPFEIPECWVWCRLGEFSEIASGVTLGKRYLQMTEKYQYLRVANVQRGYLILEEIKCISIPPKDAEKIILERNDLLVIEGNGSIKEIGRCAIWNNEIENCIHQNHIIRVRFRIDIMSNFILNYLNSPFGKQKMKQLAITTTGLFTLSVGKINNLPIPLSPIFEQQQIVAKLGELMQYCDQLEESIKTSQRQNKVLLQQVLREALEPEQISSLI